jgi:hypothetical protein
MSLQEVSLYMVWLLVYIFAGKMIIDDLYIGNRKIKRILWIFWCPFVLAISIWFMIDQLIDKLNINIKK